MNKETNYAKKHRDVSREKFQPFVVIGIPEDCTPSLAYSLVAKGHKGTVKHAMGTWEGKAEHCIIALGMHPETARKVGSWLDQESILYVSPTREAKVLWEDGRKEYVGRWECQGVFEPEGEDWTFYNGRYYTCRKYQGED